MARLLHAPCVYVMCTLGAMGLSSLLLLQLWLLAIDTPFHELPCFRPHRGTGQRSDLNEARHRAQPKRHPGTPLPPSQPLDAQAQQKDARVREAAQPRGSGSGGAVRDAAAQGGAGVVRVARESCASSPAAPRQSSDGDGDKAGSPAPLPELRRDGTRPIRQMPRQMRLTVRGFRVACGDGWPALWLCLLPIRSAHVGNAAATKTKMR